MSKLRICSFSISVDGYGAGPNQSLENPLGVGGEALHSWLVRTRTFKKTYGESGLQARLVDELHLAVSPLLLGSGEHLFAGLDLLELGYTCSSGVNGTHASHFVITK
jgi:hypothetical protein